MRGKRLDTNRRSRSRRLGPVAVLLSIVTLLSVVAPYGVVGAGPVGIASAAEPTPVPADGNITASGHYVLDGDFSGPITITANDVVLDGQGHWVNGTDSTGIGVNVTDRANVTVRNLSTYNWGTAIFYDTAVGGEVRDVSLWGAPSPPDFLFGVHVFNSSGVTVQGSRTELLTSGVFVQESADVAVLENSGDRISALSSTNVTVAHNDAVNNGNHGILLSNTTHSVVENNTATGNSPYGIHLDAGSDDNRIADNNASDNGQAGIVLDSSADNVLVGNDASGNDGSGEQTGIRLDKSSNNVIADTNASNNLYGVHIWNSDDNVVRNVTAVGNTEAGIYVEWTGTRNMVTASNASNNGNYGVLLEDWVTDTVVNDTVATGNVHGVFVRDGSNGTTIENNELSENSNSGVTVSGTSENPSAKPSILRNNVTGNSFGINLRYAPDANVANNTVTGQGATGMYVRFSENASVSDNTITRNDKGIILTLASANATIGNNTIVNNTRNGIVVDSDRTSMNGTVVKGNEIVGNGNPFSTLSGLRLVDIQDVLVYDNLFNNSQNVTLFDAGITWNVTKTAGTNVVGGQFIGGNAWLAPDGLGFSQTCADDDGDGLCDSSLTVTTGNVDYLPLAVTGAPAPTSPEIAVSPTSLDFGGVTAGNSTSLDVTIENVGTATLSVTGTTLGGTDTGAFSVSNGGSFTLAPGENRTVSVTYTPPANATHGAVLNVTANDTDEPETVVSLSGTGLSASGGPPASTPDVSLTPLSYDYGTVTVGNNSNTTVLVENVGNASLSITDTVVTGTDAGEFSIAAGGGARVLPAGANLSVTVAFTPSSSGSKSASFTVHTNDSDEPTVTASLSGTGQAASGGKEPEPDISVTPTAHDYGNVTVGSAASASVLVENVGTAPLSIQAPVVTASGTFSSTAPFTITSGGDPHVLPAGSNRTITVEFAPTASGSNSVDLSITSNDTHESVVSVSLSGNGVSASSPAPSSGTITGTVVDQADTPLSGVLVTGYGPTGTNSTTTDANGDFSLSVEPGFWGLDLSKSGYGTTSAFVEVNASETESVSVTLEAPGTIAGTVVDSSGGAIQGATVTTWGVSSGTTTTDANGQFSLDVAAGDYFVKANRSGYSTDRERDVEVTAGGATTLTFTLTQPGYVTGTVLEEGGSAASNAYVMADGGGETVFGRTNASGAFNLSVSPGNYTVSAFEASGRGMTTANGPVTVTGGGTADAGTLRFVTPDVLASDVSYVSGAKPDMSNVSVAADVQGGMMLVQLIDESASAGPGMPHDLGGLGADDTTVLEITLTIDDYDPSALLWGARDVTWTATPNGTTPSATDLTIRTKTVHLAGIDDPGLPVGPLQFTSPDRIQWPRGAQDRADLGWENTVYFVVYDLSNVPSGVSQDLAGMTVVTNAQTFSRPQMVDDTLRVYAAGPHFTTDGAVHDGFYSAFVPDAQLDAWGVSDPETELTANWAGDSGSFTVEETADGAWIHLDVHYSDGYAEIEPDTGGSSGSSGAGSTGRSSSSSVGAPTLTPSSASTTVPTTSPATQTPTSTAKRTTAGVDMPTTTAADSERPTTTTTAATGQPGFGQVIAVVALVAATLFALRRRR